MALPAARKEEDSDEEMDLDDGAKMKRQGVGWVCTRQRENSTGL